MIAGVSVSRAERLAAAQRLYAIAGGTTDQRKLQFLAECMWVTLGYPQARYFSPTERSEA